MYETDARLVGADLAELEQTIYLESSRITGITALSETKEAN